MYSALKVGLTRYKHWVVCALGVFVYAVGIMLTPYTLLYDFSRTVWRHGWSSALSSSAGDTLTFSLLAAEIGIAALLLLILVGWVAAAIALLLYIIILVVILVLDRVEDFGYSCWDE